jgi:O-antigen ligase
MVSVASKPTKSVPIDRPTSIFNMPIEFLLGWLFVAGCAFLNLANVMVDKGDVGLDTQVLAKLGMTGLAGLYGLHGLLTRARVRQLLVSFPVAWILIILAFYFAAVPFSTSPKASLVSTCTILAITLLMLTALVHLGILHTIKALFFGMAAYIAISWMLYLFVPSIGVFAEPITGGQFVHRMSGLSHPNTLGQYSGLTVVLTVILYFSYKQRSWFILLVGVLALAALINSFSRTSLMACFLALLVGYRHIYLQSKYIGKYILLATALLLGVLVLSTQMDLGEKLESKLTLLSKSDDADELTTATGRSEIWSHAIYLLKDRPATGYGAATQRFHMSEFSSYTHNMVLNIAFSAGYFAGIAGLLMIFGRIRALFHNRHPLSDAIVVFIIVNGLFENVIFSILAGLPTMLWVMALAWPLFADDEAVKMLERSKKKLNNERKGNIRLEVS